MRTMIAVVALALSAGTAGAQELSKGAILALSCAACHGTDGVSPGAMPTLAGRSPAYINNRMQAFKSGKRASTVMGRIAKGYSDEEIAAIADHFASLKQE